MLAPTASRSPFRSVWWRRSIHQDRRVRNVAVPVGIRGLSPAKGLDAQSVFRDRLRAEPEFLDQILKNRWKRGAKFELEDPLVCQERGSIICVGHDPIGRGKSP